MNKKNGSKDNILDLTKYLDEQKLQYIVAIWAPQEESNKVDNVTLYTSFKKNSIKKLSDVLKDSLIVEEMLK